MKGWNKESCFQIVVGFLSHCWTQFLPGKWNGPSIILFGGENYFRHDFPQTSAVYLCTSANTLTIPLYDDDYCEYDEDFNYTHNSQMYLMTNCQLSPQLDKERFFTKVAAKKTCISTFKLSNMSMRYFEFFNNEYL